MTQKTECRKGHCRIILSDSPDDERVHTILERIRAFNDANSEHFKRMRNIDLAWRPMSVFAAREDGEILGGLLGHTNEAWGWMTINHLWIDEDYRRMGYGTELVAKAEQECLRRNCTRVELQTWSFQAPEFYTRSGYRIVGQLDDNPPGVTRYWLAKDLT